jgi:hypothetical protein
MYTPTNNQQSPIIFMKFVPISNQQSPINNHRGGGVDIFSFSGEKAWGQKETFVKYRQTQG